MLRGTSQNTLSGPKRSWGSRETSLELLALSGIFLLSINLLVVYRESVNLIGYITRRLSADSQQL